MSFDDLPIFLIYSKVCYFSVSSKLLDALKSILFGSLPSFESALTLLSLNITSSGVVPFSICSYSLPVATERPVAIARACANPSVGLPSLSSPLEVHVSYAYVLDINESCNASYDRYFAPLCKFLGLSLNCPFIFSCNRWSLSFFFAIKASRTNFSTLGLFVLSTSWYLKTFIPLWTPRSSESSNCSYLIFSRLCYCS